MYHHVSNHTSPLPNLGIKIAEHFNINKWIVYDIKQGRTWRGAEG